MEPPLCVQMSNGLARHTASHACCLSRILIARKNNIDWGLPRALSSAKMWSAVTQFVLRGRQLSANGPNRKQLSRDETAPTYLSSQRRSNSSGLMSMSRRIPRSVPILSALLPCTGIDKTRNRFSMRMADATLLAHVSNCIVQCCSGGSLLPSRQAGSGSF
jgi:hypothetical protein